MARRCALAQRPAPAHAPQLISGLCAGGVAASAGMQRPLHRAWCRQQPATSLQPLCALLLTQSAAHACVGGQSTHCLQIGIELLRTNEEAHTTSRQQLKGSMHSGKYGGTAAIGNCHLGSAQQSRVPASRAAHRDPGSSISGLLRKETARQSRWFKCVYEAHGTIVCTPAVRGSFALTVPHSPLGVS